MKGSRRCPRRSVRRWSCGGRGWQRKPRRKGPRRNRRPKRKRKRKRNKTAKWPGHFTIIEVHMGQKVHPNGFRVGITEGWNSRWFAPKKLFGELLVEDQQIRSFVDNKLNRQPPYAAVAKVEIERTREELKVLLHT